MLSTEDRIAIYELIALHGHLVDDGRLDELGRVFADDAVHDLTAFGLGMHRGLGSVRESALALGDANPLGHHVTNTIITAVNDDGVLVRSKGIGVRADGASGTVIYDDLVARRNGEWRIVRRAIMVHRKPLGRE
jgi:hypothetical protein